MLEGIVKDHEMGHRLPDGVVGLIRHIKSSAKD